MALLCTKPFILPSSQYDLDNVERDIKYKIIIFFTLFIIFCYISNLCRTRGWIYGIWLHHFAHDFYYFQRELLCLSLEVSRLIAKDCHFERLNVSEPVALKMFEDNRFKSQQIPAIAETSHEKGTVTLYRVDDHIDICRGPLASTTGQIGRFTVAAVSRYTVIFRHHNSLLDFGELIHFHGRQLFQNCFCSLQKGVYSKRKESF